jgi:hypothetical protein
VEVRVPVPVPLLEGGMKGSMLLDLSALFFLRRTTKNAPIMKIRATTTPPTTPIIMPVLELLLDEAFSERHEVV